MIRPADSNRRIARQDKPRSIDVTRAVPPAALLNGQELHAEEMLQAIGRYLHFDGMACVWR
jgi:hypothetical protein